MNTPPSWPPDAADRHALVDGRLPAEAATQLRAGLDAAAQGEVAAWAQQRTRLQELHGDWLERPAPDALRHAAERLDETQAARARRLHWGGLAAGWLLAFGLGWTVHGQWGESVGGARLAAAPPPAFARQAALAYAVYQPEQRHPVEVGAAQQDHLVQWLSKRLARPLVVPNLQVQGFALLGGRLLPGEGGARAQLMYQDAAGARITLYLGALAGGALAQETAFRFYGDGPVSSFYWVDRGFGYAISSELPRQTLEALAHAVHAQISAARPG